MKHFLLWIPAFTNFYNLFEKFIFGLLSTMLHILFLNDSRWEPNARFFILGDADTDNLLVWRNIL